MSIHFNGTSFQNHGTQVNDRDADVFCNCERNSIVQGEGRVPTPAVESPIQDDLFVIFSLDENRAVVPNPKVVGWAQQKIDLTEINLSVFKELRDVSGFFVAVGDDVHPFAG